MKRSKLILEKREGIIFGIIFLFSLLLSSNFANAQQFSIFNFDTTNFPTMNVMFSAKTAAGNDYNNITVDDFDVFENGIPMDAALSIDCDEVEGYPPVAIHFMLDASQSMQDDAGNGQSRFKWVKDGLDEFLDTIHIDPPSEIAALTFAGIIKNYSGFVDEDSLRRWKEKALKVEFGSTDFGPPFVAHTPKFMGALFNLATRDPNLRRVAIFISDGQPERNFTQAVVDSIIRVAKREKIQVYALFITSSINNEINDICRMTGGKSYRVYQKYDMIKIFREIVGTIQNKKQCRLVWTAPFGCEEADRTRELKVVFHRIPDSAQTTYLAPTTSIANVTVSETQLKFGRPGQGTTRQPLELTSSVTDMTITGFTLNPGNGKYTVDWNGQTLPFVIPKGQKHTIYVEYIENPPTQSEKTELHLQGNPCNPPVVDLIAPCGGNIMPEVDFGNVPINTTSDKTINCIYENTTPIDIGGDVQLTGTDASEFEIVSGAGPFTLAPGGCLTVTLRFKPTTTPGPKTATLEYNTDGDCGPAVTELKGEAIQSSFPLPVLDFGKKRVLSDNTMQYEIKNTSVSQVVINTISLHNAGDVNFSLSNLPSLPLTLQPDETVTLDVNFKPQDEGSKTNYIDLTIENLSEKVSGQITGFGTLPKVVAADIDFGSVITGATDTKDLVINNPSTTEDLTVFEVIMPANNDFAFVSGTITDDFTVTMNGGNVSLPIEFTPQSPGLKSVKVLIRCDAATGNPPYLFVDTVEVTGIGLGLDITPTEYTFANTLTCGYREATFVINNTNGTEDITVNSITFTGTGNSAFAVVPPQPTTIPVGETADFIVRFEPPNPGAYVAQMVVNTNVGMATIDLSGLGTVTPVKPEIAEPLEKILPGSVYPLKFQISVPSLDGGEISYFTAVISFYGKSFNLKSDNDVTVPNINGWNWNIGGTGTDRITITGSGTPIPAPHTFDFTVKFQTYLADEAHTFIMVKPDFPENNCIVPLNDTLPITINTCFTEGRLVLVSEGEYYLSRVAPNPADESFTLDFGLAFDSYTKIKIYNSMGELVIDVKDGELTKGKYELTIPVTSLAAGVYFIKMEAGPFTKVRKLIINK